MIDRDYDDGQGTKEIESGLAFTTGEARIDCYFGSWLVNGGRESRK
ncbi:MAG: hypothetical protein ABR611_03285 [Chthoniobacterales bacterium]